MRTMLPRRCLGLGSTIAGFDSMNIFSLGFWSVVHCFLAFSIAACARGPEHNSSNTTQDAFVMNDGQILDTVTFGAGCFWCVEAVYQQLNGVVLVQSGYSGGPKPNPTYKEVCTGTTNHAEVCQIVYDATKISFRELLEVFWSIHDPTTLNRQGNDVGTQYRSVVFYHNDQQKTEAEFYKKKLEEEKAFSNPIVTEISPFLEFYKAEDYHQNYFNDNGSQPYCTMVVRPKVEKFKKAFKEKLKQ